MTKDELLAKAEELKNRTERFSIKPEEFFEFIKEIINLIPDEQP